MPEDSFHYVDDAASLEDLARHIGSYPHRIAVDTEADSLHHYFEKVCLIQVSVGEDHYIVDPLAGFSLGDLLAALSERDLVLHGADYDLRMLRASFGFEIRAEVFDTMLAAQVLGYKELGLAALVKRHFAVELPKHGQKADWSRRPIPEKLLEYAYNDTRYLERLACALEAELLALGRREWHREACAHAVRSSAEPPRPRTDSDWRIKGARLLPPPALAVLKALWEWRDAEARRADLPPFKVLANQRLLDLAQWAVANRKERARQWPDLPRRCSPRRLASLEAAVAQGRHAPALPRSAPARRNRTGANNRDDENLIKALKEARDQAAATLGMDPSILAPRNLLVAISRDRPKTLDEMLRTERMLPWQVNLLGAAFLEVLSRDESDPAAPAEPSEDV